MTDYLKPKFTVPMPGKDVDWPFDHEPITHEGMQPCRECGQATVPGRAHIDKRDEDAKRSRKRVCFGKVVAG